MQTDTLLYRPFIVTTTLIKADAQAHPDGPWIVSGPIKPAGEDYDGQILDDMAIEKGMVYHKKFGSHVDFAHMYNKTKDLKWIVGRGEQMRGPEGDHWLKTILQKGKDKAKEIWDNLHLEPPTALGYSIQGILKAVDKKDKRRIVDSEIHFITIDPAPKGFGNFLQIGVPATTMGVLTKAIAGEFLQETLPEPWQSTPIEYADSLDMVAMMQGVSARVARLEESLRKALETGAGIVGEGATGGAALRGQAFAHEQKRCPGCGAKNRATRKCCRKCGKAMESVAAEKALSVPDPLVASLREQNIPQAESVAKAVRDYLAAKR